VPNPPWHALPQLRLWSGGVLPLGLDAKHKLSLTEAPSLQDCGVLNVEVPLHSMMQGDF